MTPVILFDDTIPAEIPRRWSGKRLRCAYPYYTSCGEHLVGLEARYQDDFEKVYIPFFRFENDKLTSGHPVDGMLTPFNLCNANAASLAGHTVYITEGGRAAVAVHSLGFPVVS